MYSGISFQDSAEQQLCCLSFLILYFLGCFDENTVTVFNLFSIIFGDSLFPSILLSFLSFRFVVICSSFVYHGKLLNFTMDGGLFIIVLIPLPLMLI